MKRCSNCRVEKGRENFYRYAKPRKGLRPICKDCHNQGVRMWQEKNKAKCRSAERRWYKRNSEYKRETLNLWRSKNKHLVAQQARRRYATRMKAVPGWANRTAINLLYKLARQKTQESGVLWTVDHIVPLKSKHVCGLHVEHNLRVVPRKVNFSKGNRYWPDMPEQINA